MQLIPRRLEGRFVRLEPFAPELKELVRSAIDCDPDSWAIMPSNTMGDRFDDFWSEACSAPPSQRVWYAIRRRADDRIVGTLGFSTALASQGGIEIGGTFLHPDARGGLVNPETKLLMLDHAFTSGAVRVQLRVDSRNARSQAAVAKLGAVREGVMRRDKLTWTGYIRDSVVFSILSDEWPAVKAGLEQRLANRR